MKEARTLLNWSRNRLAAMAGVPIGTVARIETAKTRGRPPVLAEIRAALEAAGVEFIDQNGGGPGVRLRNQE
jgi:transcriptional regulator with XRE-family HTH domain